MKVISETVRITRTTIEAAWRCRAVGLRLTVRDSGCRGLALIVNPTAMRWVYAYRPHGTDPRTCRRWPNRTVTIGNPASHSPEDARTEANRIKGQVAAGAEPTRANPCADIARARRPQVSQARAHNLTPEELAGLWRAVEGLREPVWRDLARFLIAVPCRHGEAARLDWLHLDLAAAEWRQPGKLTKNREPHRLYLHPLALEILNARNDAAGKPKDGFVFPAPESDKPVDTFSDVKKMLAEVAGMNGWTWHDFRRSFAAALGEAGIPEAVADAVLNHRQSASRGGVLGTYRRASRWPEQVRAMQFWGRLLAAAIEGGGPGPR
jgi:integrase